MSWVKQNLCPFAHFAMILLLSEVMPWSVTAQVLIPPEPGNKVSVTVNADGTFDASAGLYTYSYKVTNSPTSLQEVWFFALKFPGDIIAVTLLALGTSIPELATGIMSLVKGHSELLVGNVIGANVLNA